MYFEFILGLVVLAVIGVVIALVAVTRFRHAFLVPEGYAGLLYHKGRFVEVLGPGRHIRWGWHFTVDAADLRKASLSVAGQEVLTADHVGIKLSVVIGYQVTDPVKAAHATQNWQGDLYNAAQLAVRATVAGATVEALMQQRMEIGALLLGLVQPAATAVGVTVQSVEVKDVTLPGELKRAFADVLKAKQEGQAALERARGESASLRHLANAARVLDGNPALMNLRLMQSLTSAQNAGNTLVLGVPGGFVPLHKTKPAGKSENSNEES